jgi:hypothetical protein
LHRRFGWLWIENTNHEQRRPFFFAKVECRGEAREPEDWRQWRGKKNAGLKAVTLIATLNPVSQVLW